MPGRHLFTAVTSTTLSIIMPRRVFKMIRFSRTKLPVIPEESDTTTPLYNTVYDREECAPELPPPRLPPPRVPARNYSGSTAGGVRKRPAYLDKNAIYENLPANHELYINVCPLHWQQLKHPYCVECNEWSCLCLSVRLTSVYQQHLFGDHYRFGLLWHLFKIKLLNPFLSFWYCWNYFYCYSL